MGIELAGVLGAVARVAPSGVRILNVHFERMRILNVHFERMMGVMRSGVSGKWGQHMKMM